MNHDLKRLLTSLEVGRLLGIHPKVLERMAKRGKVPALKIGKFWRYHPDSLAKWIDSRLQSACAPSCKAA
jgi:excisionase family DNA binding protein